MYQKTPPLKRIYQKLRRRFAPLLLRLVLPVEPRRDLERLGSDYGGWVIPVSLLSEDSVCYLAGVGEDISFDLSLIERFGCRVHAFDPTPRAAEHVARTAPSTPKFTFHQVGLWSSDERLRFYAPSNRSHVSHSIVNLHGTADYFEADCRSVSSLMEELGHPRLNLLKLDVEGAEHEVLGSVLQARIFPKIICVEFDQPTPVSRTVGAVRRVLDAGYDLVCIDDWNYTMVKRER